MGLAYWKARNPKKFWHAALKHCQSMYAWVHISEAKRAGLKFVTIGSNWVRDGEALYDPKQTPFLFSDGYAEYKKHGYWISSRCMLGCTEMRLGEKIRLRGLIATYRGYVDKDKRLTIAAVGSGTGSYWELVLEGIVPLHKFDLIDVVGEFKIFFGRQYVRVTKLNGFKALDRDWKIPQETQQEHLSMRL